MNDFMTLAIKEAEKAYKKEEIPVGCVIVLDNKIISKGYNNRQKKYNVLGHAEINAILKAEKVIKDWRLDKCDMYVTLVPCDMCKTIIKESRINHVYYLINNTDNIVNDKDYSQITDDNELIKEYKNKFLKFFIELRK